MAAYVTDHVRPGSIIELHPWGEGAAPTRQAIPMLIADLRRQGYTFVTVSRLLDLR
jgi:peptidoglycan/xylan/chitin deacetylase (PgdA/CDA1 family)